MSSSRRVQTDRPLKLSGVAKRFDDVLAVDQVDLDLEPGELLALVGPSGCGKSTLLRSIAGLIPIDSGTIHLGGRLVDDGAHQVPPERRATGLVFQEHALFPHLTVQENVSFGLRNRSRNKARRVDEMLELVSLGGYGARYPHELSGGERQRVALARALAPAPHLMLFDEPFASLDQNLRVQLRRDVAAALRAMGTPAVFVTHDQQEALAMGDRIAVMRDGSIHQLASPEIVFHHPSDTFVGSFMGQASFLPIDESSSTVLGQLELRGLDPRRCVAMVRPDDVIFTPDRGGDTEIVATEYHGSSWEADAQINGEAMVRFSCGHLQKPELGQRGRLSLTPGHEQVAVPTVQS